LFVLRLVRLAPAPTGHTALSLASLTFAAF
jgi:hypothetical protein